MIVEEYKKIHGLLKLEDSGEYLTSIMKEQFRRSITLFTEEYKLKKKQCKDEFLKVMDKLFQKGIEKQMQENKAKVAYLCIFYLKSSIMTGTYQMQINLYDQNLYLDTMDVSVNWDATFLMKFYEEDMKKLNKLANRNIYKWSYREYQLLKMEYSDVYRNILELYCVDLIRDILQLETYKKLDKEDNISAYFGGYLEKLHCIYPIENTKEG